MRGTLFACSSLALSLVAASALGQPVAPSSEHATADAVTVAPESAAPATPVIAPGPMPTTSASRGAAVADLDPAANAVKVSPELLAQRSLGFSPQLAQRDAELQVARARYDQAVAQFLPRLTLRASYTRLSTANSTLGEGSILGAANAGPVSVGACAGAVNPCVVDSQGVPLGAAPVAIDSVNDNLAFTAALNVPLSDYILRLSGALDAAAANRTAATTAIEAERLRTATEAKVVYYELFRSKSRVRLARQSVDQVQARLRDMERSFQLGAATRADVLRLRAQAASMDQVVLEATSYSRLVEVRIAIMLREPESTHYEVGAELSATHSGSNEELSRLLAEAQASRLELRALSQRADAERLSASSVTSGNWPRLDGFGEAQYANPNPRYFPPEDKWRSSWALGVALSWTPLDLFGNSAAASGFTANARAVEAQQQALVNAIREEVADQHFAAQRADGALVAAEQGLASAEESYRVAATSFAEGEGTSREVVDAEADLLAARLNELNSRIDRHVAEARLDHALGRDVVRKR